MSEDSTDGEEVASRSASDSRSEEPGDDTNNQGTASDRRVRRSRSARKARSRSSRRRQATRYAVVGAAASLMVFGVLYGFVIVLSTIAHPTRSPSSISFGERIRLVGGAVADFAARAGAALIQHAHTLLIIVLIMILGAIGGIVAYRLQRAQRRRGTRRASRRTNRRRKE